MADVIFKRGTKAEIDAEPISDGKILFTTDQTYNQIYADNGTKRIQIGGTMDMIQTLVPIGYMFPWSPVSGSTLDLSTAQKVHDHFGFGTWQAIKDRTLIGAGGSYAVNSEGGSATKTLTVKNLPSHSHSYSGTTGSENVNHTHYIPALSGSTSGGGNHNHGMNNVITGLSTTNFGTAFGQTALNGYFPFINSVSASGDHAHTVTTNASTTGSEQQAHQHSYSGTSSSVGSGTALDVMNPYKAVYIWQRIA